ncbi:MAG TPA: type IV pilus assembly protein PilM [Solirubrobacterales bacterium]|jgi:type IV pilus assembly protein PilM|nr:type IV pilus assembly protein PilM [Solirubrobacterales bacterium]
MQLTKPINLPKPSLGSLGALRRGKKSGNLAGLSIEAGSVAVAEVAVNGSTQLTASAVQPLRPGVFHEGEVIDPSGLTAAVKELYSRHKLPKQVRLGIGNQRVIVRTLRLPLIEDPKEIEAAIRFQAQEHIPMPLDQAVLQHQVVGGVPAEEGAAPQVDVVVVAARREMVASFLEPLRRAGLEPAGIDLSAFGMIRALAPLAAQPAQAEEGSPAPQESILYCNVGDVMNLAVARDRSCLFTRVSGAGMESMVARLSTERALNPEHAEQWLLYVGLETPLAGIEGDPETLAAARRTNEEGVAAMVDELRLSLDYYRALESAVPVSRVVLCGTGSAIQGLAPAMEEQVGLPISAPRPAALGGLDEAIAARLVLPMGLGLES